MGIGLIESRTGNRDAAEAGFKEAVRLNPRSPTARATLGNFYLREKRTDLAEEQLKAAAECASARSLLSMSYADLKIRQGQVEEGGKLLAELAAKREHLQRQWRHPGSGRRLGSRADGL